MAETDIATTISDVRLFIEKLKSDLPEVFAAPSETAGAKVCSGKVLYQGDLLETEIRLNPDITKPSAALEDGRLIIYIKNEAENCGSAAENWLRAQANEILPAKIKEWAQKIGVEFNNIAIKDQKTMWASCSQKNNLNFSYRIIKMPAVIIDYLIVHELTHLIHFNHGSDYWQTVEQYCPGYREHRKWLNNNRYAVMADSDIKYIPPARQPLQPGPSPQHAQTEQETKPDA
jgi:predicted metal-dependent hydrolase